MAKFKWIKKSLAILALGMCSSAFAADVNLASRAQLESTRGIGESLAQRILSERAAHGAFKSWADFKSRVKGVGDKNVLVMQSDGLTLGKK